MVSLWVSRHFRAPSVPARFGSRQPWKRPAGVVVCARVLPYRLGRAWAYVCVCASIHARRVHLRARVRACTCVSSRHSRTSRHDAADRSSSTIIMCARIHYTYIYIYIYREREIHTHTHIYSPGRPQEQEDRFGRQGFLRARFDVDLGEEPGAAGVRYGLRF